MDELYHFIERKANSETRENTYVTSLVSMETRQIIGFAVAFDKSPERLQVIVDNSPEAESYATNGYLAYIDLVYPRKHIRNIKDKKDTFTVEAVLFVFIEAYNKFGEAKQKYRARRHNLGRSCREVPFGMVDFL